ncbi:MAG: flagellar basal body L-ring protein FlgH [Rhodoferax sp.]|nr:flagellar basal body L-ring protein FlgH [Rhodoferax sp.]
MKNISAPALSIRATGFFSLLSVGFCALTACQQLPQKATVDFAEPKVSPAPLQTGTIVRPTSGSLFQTATYRPAFEDRRARMIGDTVTIQILENISASQTSTSTLNRASDNSATITPPLPNVLGDLSNLNMKTDSKNNFSGKGLTSSINTFTGSITTTVTEVLPNGHLVVTGEKQIGVNQNVDVLRFSGTIDPRLVQPGNIIRSTQVANVRVESRGRGAQGEAQTVGWLSRFFLSFNPF